VKVTIIIIIKFNKMDSINERLPRGQVIDQGSMDMMGQGCADLMGQGSTDIMGQGNEDVIEFEYFDFPRSGFVIIVERALINVK
jgi:hypothetical protein